MNESKAKNIIVASTVGAVLLVVILVAVMIYQLISVSNYKKDIAELEKAIADYNQMIADGEDELEAKKTLEWIKEEAKKLGYRFDDEIFLN